MKHYRQIFFAKHFISEEKPTEYYNAASDALAHGRTAFLANPSWSPTQKAEAEACSREILSRRSPCASPAIFIASGGSGGKIRFISHTLDTLTASARGLIALLEKKISPRASTLNCFACLPPWHISGIMPLIRSRISGGEIFISGKGSFHPNSPLPKFRKNAGEFWMNSLVPTQLHRLFEHSDGIEWLREFDFVLLGGASVSPELLERAQKEKIPLAVGYGTTETASLVALGTAPDFLAGTPLPHAKIEIGNDRQIKVFAESLSPDCGKIFETKDEGFFDEKGKLHVIGRLDRFINSGGEKIDPQLVESAILKTGIARETLVVGKPDTEWGTCVIAFLPETSQEKIPELRDALRKILPREMIPKHFICVPELPLDEKGKIDHAKLANLLGS